METDDDYQFRPAPRPHRSSGPTPTVSSFPTGPSTFSPTPAPLQGRMQQGAFLSLLFHTLRVGSGPGEIHTCVVVIVNQFVGC